MPQDLSPSLRLVTAASYNSPKDGGKRYRLSLTMRKAATIYFIHRDPISLQKLSTVYTLTIKESTPLDVIASLPQPPRNFFVEIFANERAGRSSTRRLIYRVPFIRVFFEADYCRRRRHSFQSMKQRLGPNRSIPNEIKHRATQRTHPSLKIR